MRIASLVPEGAPSNLYRSFIPMQALALAGHRVHVEERNTVGDPGPLLGIDAVHIFRIAHRPAQRLAKTLLDAGVAVVWDNDYDLAAAPADHPVGRALRGLEQQQAVSGVHAMMRLATVVTAPTEELAERHRAAGADDVRIYENMLPPTFTRARTLPPRGLTIGWAAMPEHEWDVRQLGLREVLTRVLERHQHVHILCVGADLGLRGARSEHLPWQAYDDLPGVMSRCDIAIAPLADVPFNATRSNVKLKEYAALGIPWLASPVGDYAWMGESEGGRLVADGDWNHQIEELVRDPDARRRLSAAGRRWAAGESVVDYVGELEQLFEHAVARAKG